MFNVADKFQTQTVNDIVCNLIPTQFPTISLYAEVAAESDYDALYELESLTNPRIIQEKRIKAMQKSATSAQLQNFNLAPMAYPNPDGTTYFDGSQPSAEFFGSEALALTVSILKREQFLRDAAMPAQTVDVRMLKRQVKGRFARVPCPKGVAQSNLHGIGQEIAANDDFQGVVYPSAIMDGHFVYGVIDGRCLEPAYQTNHYAFYWDGAKIAKIGDYALGTSYDSVELMFREDDGNADVKEVRSKSRLHEV